MIATANSWKARQRNDRVGREVLQRIALLPEGKRHGGLSHSPP
jgi:hypothetical protein